MISIGFWSEAFAALCRAEKERVANAGDDELKRLVKGAADMGAVYDLIKGPRAGLPAGRPCT